MRKALLILSLILISLSVNVAKAEYSYANYTDNGTTSLVYVSTSQVDIPINIYHIHNITISFKMSCSGCTEGVDFVYGKIYRNGIAIGTERSISTVTLTEYTESFYNIPSLTSSDKFQIYQKRSGPPGTAHVDDFIVNISSESGNWSFFEGSGSWANDTSGFNNNGSITGASWTTDSVNGSALSFDGINDYVTIPTSVSLNISSAQSFTGWIKPQSLSGIARYIFMKGAVGKYEYGLYTDGNILSYATWTAAGGAHGVTSYTVPNLTKTFISGTYQDGVLQTLEINNVQVASTSSFLGTQGTGDGSAYFGYTSNGFAGIVDEFKLYNYVINASERIADYQAFQPVPAYPTGGMTISATYPPQTSSVNITWHDTEWPSDELIVAKDAGFNQLVVDAYTSNDYYAATLDLGTTYYWKVKQYNGTTGTFGDTSTTETFTLGTSVPTGLGSSIQGTVYEIAGGLSVPVSGATVYLSDAAATVSKTQIVGSNGYYLFTGLANNTVYYVSAKSQGYDDSVVSYVNITGTANGNTTTKDILLTVCISGLTCFGTQNYVKFVATDFFGNLYSGLTVNVFKGTDAIAKYTATTGTDGGASFKLTKDQSYRLVFSGTGITTTTITIVPGETVLFYVYVSASTPLPWWNNVSYQEAETVVSSVTTAESGGVAFVNVSYNDSLAQTTAWTIYLNQTNHTNITAAQLQLQTATGTGNFSQSFAIASGYSGNSYLVNIVATHTTFGTIQRSYGVQFYGTRDGSLNFIPSAIMAVIAIAILVFVGAFFDSTNYAQGAALLCVIGWIELGFGMFSYANMYISVGIGLGIASVLAVIMNMNERNKKEVMG